VLHRRTHPRTKHHEILPIHVFQERYDLTAESYTPPRLDPEAVPQHLRDLLPMATKWGIGDDVIRDDFQEKASEEEKLELQRLLNGKGQAINDWLDSFGNNLMSDEAAAFMYMMLGLDEMEITIDLTDGD
jgi:hypothetical protein